MISFDQALTSVLESCHAKESEDIPVANCLGRHLAEDVFSKVSLPHFDNSAVDGFAVLASDLNKGGAELPITNTIFAGDDPALVSFSPGTTVRIMTGAGLPDGPDSVVMQEDVTVNGDRAFFESSAKVGHHIRRAGEEVSAGDLVLQKGVFCAPSVLGALASLGSTSAKVVGLPKIGILTTGAELASPGEELAPGQIYESNLVAISSAVRSLGVAEVIERKVGDDFEETVSALRELVGACDLVISTGGASVGERDYVRTALLELGVEEKFWKVAIKPGKPVFFGTGTCPAFGLPGNPVSALVTFELFVTPAIKKMMGDPSPVTQRTKVVLAKEIKRKPGRLEFVRAMTSSDSGQLIATPIEKQGSHMMSGLANSDRLLIIPAYLEFVEAGTVLESVPLRRGMSL